MLILDEATSSLDAENEYQVQLAIDALLGEQDTKSNAKQQCLLVIGHRLSTVKDAACITVLQGGVVVEYGERTMSGQFAVPCCATCDARSRVGRREILIDCS